MVLKLLQNKYLIYMEVIVYHVVCYNYLCSSPKVKVRMTGVGLMVSCHPIGCDLDLLQSIGGAMAHPVVEFVRGTLLIKNIIEETHLHSSNL